MGHFLLLLSIALVVGAIVFGVAVLISGEDPGLVAEEPEGRATPLPSARPLVEDDIGVLRFDTALRGYRMSQVDAALGRAAYDLGFKEELIGILEAEVIALRDGRIEDADSLRASRQAALGGSGLIVTADDDDLDANREVGSDDDAMGLGDVRGEEDAMAGVGLAAAGSDPARSDSSATATTRADGEPGERTTGPW
jgi:DivIVA domain-containing protein